MKKTKPGDLPRSIESINDTNTQEVVGIDVIFSEHIHTYVL